MSAEEAKSGKQPGKQEVFRFFFQSNNELLHEKKFTQKEFQEFSEPKEISEPKNNKKLMFFWKPHQKKEKK